MDFLSTNPALRTPRFGIPRETKSTKYPIRLLRYWFGYHLLRQESEALDRPLRIAEIGVHTGQMLEFYLTTPDRPPVQQWTAFDAVLLPEKLKKAGYTDLVEANLEDLGFTLSSSFDAVLLLHILEHLFDPEEALRRLAKELQPGSIIIGGFPVVPHPLAAIRQNQIQKTAAPMGHVSVFSTKRIRQMASYSGLALEFLTGAFFFRCKGSLLENSRLWLRLNLLWGALFPAWPGEAYWLMRKPHPDKPPETTAC